MVSVASLLNHVPSETVQRIQLPPSPMSTSSSHRTNSASPTSTSTSTSPATNASSLALNRLVHNSSVHQANGHISGDTCRPNTPNHHSNNHSNTSNPGPPRGPGQGQVIKKQKMSKDGAVFLKGKIKGDINFPPFEDLDDLTTSEVLKFHVYPLGKIMDYPRHIPYNSEKKTFLEKTGRESFEVFQYVFRVPDDDKDYTVMWDYQTGLVRITPFFKCCKFTKTTPAKMLNLNPGLKDITHSITGGALVAQGYWMPYACALAVCATFCHHIAPALIPIFGPSFPSRCVVPEAPEHGRFSIDPAIVIESTKEAERYRMLYSSATAAGHVHGHTRGARGAGDMRRGDAMLSPPRSTPGEMRLTDPRDMDRGRERERDDLARERERRGREYDHDHRDLHTRTPLPSSNYLGKRLRLKRPYGDTSPYGSVNSTDTDIGYNSESSTNNDRYLCSPFTPSSEKGGNSGSGFSDHPYIPAITPPRTHAAELPSPYLSAVPGGRALPNFFNSPAHHGFGLSSSSLNGNHKYSPYPPPLIHPHQNPHPTSTTSSPEFTRRTLHNNSIPPPPPLPQPNGNGNGNGNRPPTYRSKRRISEVLNHHEDSAYDGEESSSGSGSDHGVHSNHSTMAETSSGGGGEGSSLEKKAAWLLMNLSVRDRSGVGLGLRLGGDGAGDVDGVEDGPRVKRRRALSMGDVGV